MVRRTCYYFFTGSTSIFAHGNYQYPFCEGDIVFDSVLQYKIYKCCCLFGDFAKADKVLRTKQVHELLKLNQNTLNYDRPIWLEHREVIVRTGELLKYKQNAKARKYLLQTGDRVIAQVIPTNDEWAIGMDISDPDIVYPSQWKGKNLAGEILMEVREVLRFEYAKEK